MYVRLVVLILSLLGQAFFEAAKNKTEDAELRVAKALSVFTVVTFPNSACGASSGYNGTCYTSSECSSKGGTASGSCASSFGVCCVFSLSCGGSSSANNSYAIISSYSVSSDADPCSYTFCKTNTDVCKLRIDFDTMVLAGPWGLSSTAAVTDGPRATDCGYDTLTVTNPGGASPPIICGYNTGQHMFIPVSNSCNTINIDVDTGTTTTTRTWQIKVSQFECGNMRAPDQDCLQYHTASSGTIATFNWDTSSTTVSRSQYHLSSQYYDICIRRARSQCSVCFSPHVASIAAPTASSYGVGASSAGPVQNAAVGSTCTGITEQAQAAPLPVNAGQGFGDYLEIVNLQPSIGTAGAVTGAVTRICGAIFNAAPAAQTAQATACSFAIPFKVGVHFDEEESIAAGANGAVSPNLNQYENDPLATDGAGYGYSGFWLNYWQNSC